jgi:lytic murein transglycosylase
LVIAGLVPAISLRRARPCSLNRDSRDKPGHDGVWITWGQRRSVHARFIALSLSALTSVTFAAPASAAKCGGDFNVFIAGMAREAQAAGVSRAIIDQAFAGVTDDQAVLAFDRRQRGMFHSRSFEEYARTRVIPPRIKRAKTLMQKNAALLARVQQQFGVPKELLMAIWTLESDNGTGDMGKLPVIRTIATLAHDCRRSELFQNELISALKIVQRGDLPLRELIGAYAGEIGQTQFLPSSYIKYGVDYDGNGHVDLRHSVPDVLASTANLLKVNGWKAGAPFGEGSEFEGKRVESFGDLPQDHGAFARSGSRDCVGVSRPAQAQHLTSHSA